MFRPCNLLCTLINETNSDISRLDLLLSNLSVLKKFEDFTGSVKLIDDHVL